MSAIQRLASHATILIVFSILFLSSLTSFAQAPDSINYQAVARDQNGNVLTNQTGTVTFRILSGSATGPVVYREDHIVTTNSYGHFNVYIGGGTQVGGANFADIDWGGSSHYLNVVIDFFGSEDMGTTQLVSVPYALYAKTAGNSLKAGDGIEIRNDSIFNAGDTSITNELRNYSKTAMIEQGFLKKGFLSRVLESLRSNKSLKNETPQSGAS